MIDADVKTLVKDLKTAIADIGVLLERKNERFQELGIDPASLEKVLTGQGSDRQVREQVLQELGDLERDLSEQVNALQTQSLGDSQERLASVNWAI